MFCFYHYCIRNLFYGKILTDNVNDLLIQFLALSSTEPIMNHCDHKMSVVGKSFRLFICCKSTISI